MAHDSTYALKDEKATLALGAALALRLRAGLVIFLQGDLGAGKTTLTRGLLQQCGYVGRVKSPTYTLVEPYSITLNEMSLMLYHFDFYRFYDADEWEAAGFRDYFNPSSICIVEWPENADGKLGLADLEIRLTEENEGRIATMQANTELGKQCLIGLANSHDLSMMA